MIGITGSPNSIKMGDDTGDKRGRGRPKKSEAVVDEVPEERTVNRSRPRKAAEAASAAVRDQSNRDDDGEPKAKRGRGRPKGSTGRKKRSKGRGRKKGTKVVKGLLTISQKTLL